MRARAVSLAVVASLVYGGFGCSSNRTPASDAGPTSIGDAPGSPSGEAPGADAAGDASPDVGSGLDAGADAQSGACAVMRGADFAACAEECDARLTLPGGGVYCSTACESTKDCAALGGDLICPDTIGACVPRCTGNASCTAGGFQRCDTQTGGCDTL